METLSMISSMIWLTSASYLACPTSWYSPSAELCNLFTTVLTILVCLVSCRTSSSSWLSTVSWASSTHAPTSGSTKSIMSKSTPNTRCSSNSRPRSSRNTNFKRPKHCLILTIISLITMRARMRWKVSRSSLKSDNWYRVEDFADDGRSN